MTVFSQKEKKPEGEGVWFKFQNSHKDKAIADQIEAIQKAAEGRVFTEEEKKSLTALFEKLFVFDPPEEDAAEFCLRSLIPFFTERMKNRKKKVEFVLNPSTRSMERISYFPDPTPEEVQKEQEDAWDYLITGMKNAKWSDGKPIECNRADKIKLMKIEEFDLFIGHCLKVLSGSEKEEADAAEKN